MDGLLLIRDLAVMLLVAGAAAMLCKRLGLSAIVGYLAAGTLIGPHTPPFALVADLGRVHTLAQLGLVFLVFSIGLNLSLARLKRLGLPVILATVVGALIVLNGGRLFGWVLGWEAKAGVFLAGMLMVSSSAIISKVLGELNQNHERAGQLALGVTVLEDVVAVTMLTVLTSMVQFGGGNPPPLLPTLGGLAVFVVTVAALALIGMPRLLRYLQRIGSTEMRTLLVGGLLCALAWLAAHAGYSLALGAFVFGAIIGSTRFKEEVEKSFLGMDQVFGAVFFVAVGTMVDFRLMAEAWPLMLAMAGVALVLRPLACTTGLLVAGNRTRDAVQAGLSLAPLGEFSFIIAQLGVESGVLPQSAYPAAVGASLLTSLAAPMMMRRSEALGRRAEIFEPAFLKRWTTLVHDVITGLGTGGRAGGVWRMTARRVVFIVVQMVVVSGLLLFANPIGDAIRETVSKSGLSPRAFGLAFWTGFGLVLLGPLVALWRNVATVSMILAEAAAPSGRAGARIRPLIEFVLKVSALLLLSFWLLALLPGERPPGSAAVVLALVVTAAALFWKRFDRFQNRLESGLMESFQEAIHPTAASAWSSVLPRRTADWKLEIEEVSLPSDTAHAGRTLGELALRGRFGCSVVGVDRQGFGIVNPRADLAVFPQDKLLLFGKVSQIAAAIRELSLTSGVGGDVSEFEELVTDTVRVPDGCAMARRPLIELDLIRRFGIQVGGIRHQRTRRLVPAGSDSFEAGDELLLIGSQAKIREFAARLTEDRCEEP